jgi:hypothetical protein
MNKPTKKQIKSIASHLAEALGSAVHLRASNLAAAVDGSYPG